MHVKRHPWSSDLHTKGKDLPDPGLRVATFANRWRYTEEGEVRDERPEPSAVAAMAMLPQKTQSPGQATVARHQWAEHRLVDVAGSSRETHLASQCSHAATAAQSAKVHPANGTRTGSAQPRPPERPPPAHDRIPTGRSAQPPFWREHISSCAHCRLPRCSQHDDREIPCNLRAYQHAAGQSMLGASRCRRSL